MANNVCINFGRVVVWAAVLTLVACASQPTEPTSRPSRPAVPAPSVQAVEAAPAVPVLTPGEEALAQGLKAYQGAQYAVAETQLKLALQSGLTVVTDVANAHKHLAFVYCTSRRESLCAAAFKAARAADPNFVLSKSEAGHPMWGPVYRRALPPTKPGPKPALKPTTK